MVVTRQLIMKIHEKGRSEEGKCKLVNNWGRDQTQTFVTRLGESDVLGADLPPRYLADSLFKVIENKSWLCGVSPGSHCHRRSALFIDERGQSLCTMEVAV